MAVPEALKTLPYRLQSIVLVVYATHHYILPRIHSSPTCFLLLTSLLISRTKRKTSLYFP
jgi:hypothetical protein